MGAAPSALPPSAQHRLLAAPAFPSSCRPRARFGGVTPELRPPRLTEPERGLLRTRNFHRHGSPCERGGGNSFRSRRSPSLRLIISLGQRPGARDPRCHSAGVRPGPQPGRLAWSRGTPAEAGLSLPANLPSSSPADTHPQGGGQCLCGEAPTVTGDAQCLHLLGSIPRLGCFSSLQAPVYPLLSGHQSPLHPISSVPRPSSSMAPPPTPLMNSTLLCPASC